MIDILLSSVVQAIMDPRWWLAVIGGAVAAVLLIAFLVYVGFLAA